MAERKRVLITGHLGFIGRVITRHLRAANHDVWGIDRIPGNDDQSFVADLLDSQRTSKLMSDIPDFQVLIHMAALAHRQKPPPSYSMLDVNFSITKNIISSLGQRMPHLIFLSSIAVYGEDERPQPVCVHAKPRPATEYGQSKLVCENLIFTSHLVKCDILRLAPVYDKQYLQDVAKRVYFPGLRGIKMRLVPPPYYSLCHVDRVAEMIKECISESSLGRRVLHVADPEPYSQHQLLEWFEGIEIAFPVIFARPIYMLGKMIPGSKGYAIRCLFSKLFLSNMYVA